MGLWIEDPKQKQPSVTLTLVVFFGAVLTFAGLLVVVGKAQSVGPFSDAFFGVLATYVGRRLSIAGKSFTSEKGDDSR